MTSQIAMKRGTNSMDFQAKRYETRREEISPILMNYSGPSFSYLPRDIMINVLLRLSIKRIHVCKIVCKAWRDLVSDPEFAKFHFDQAQVYPLIQVPGSAAPLRMLYFVQPEEDDFELKLEMCDHTEYKPECDCFVRFELDTKFKLPLHNLDSVLNNVIGGNTGFRMKDLKYSVVDSCNGMLCLSSTYDNDPLAICNPITGEYVNLPDSEVEKVKLSRNILCGFGFSPATNQYKVVKMFPDFSLDETSNNNLIWAKVHTVGTETWKDIEFSARGIHGLYPTYLNGFLYWPFDPSIAYPLCLASFDIENECFGSISAPVMEDSMPYREVRVGVLGGELSISCHSLSKAVVEVWVMKDCHTKNVWSKVFSFHKNCNQVWCFGLWQPIKYLNDGALLMFNSNKKTLMYKHPRKGRIRYLKFIGCTEQLEVTAHIPCLVSLKDALSVHDVMVLKTRNTELKLMNEDKGIYVREIRVIY